MVQNSRDDSVRLVAYTPEPEKVIYVSARVSYSRKPFEEVLAEAEDTERVRRFLWRLYKSGHHSVFEHVSFTFWIEGCSRVCTHQLVRHRHASFTQQSLRYSKPFQEGGIVVPDKVWENGEVLKQFVNRVMLILCANTPLFKGEIQRKVCIVA